MEEWYRQLIIDFIESLTNKWDIEKEKAMYVCVHNYKTSLSYLP